MDRTSAVLILGAKEEDDLDELWEERLFEHKQFFLTRPPILKVWEARLDKLQKQYRAYCHLSSSEVKEGIEKLVSKETKNELLEQDMLTVFNKHFATRSSFKLRLNQSYNVLEVIRVVRQWIAEELNYAQKWFCEEALNDKERNVVVSKEPDPMEILEALKKWQEGVGNESQNNICSAYSFLPEILKNEVKRLTSLYKRSI